MADVQKALDEGANPNRIINRVVYYMANTCGQLSTLGCNSNNIIIIICTSVLFMPDTHTQCTCTLHACIHAHTHTQYTYVHIHSCIPPYSHTHPLPSFSLLALIIFVDRQPSKIPNYSHHLSSTDTTNPYARGLPTWAHRNCKASP